MMYKQKDIVLVNVPYANGVGAKIRPVLIISNALLNNVDEFIFLPITGTNFNDNFSVPLSNKMALVEFPKLSYLRLNKINSLHKQYIIRKVNGINKEMHNLIINELFKLFK